MKQHYSSCHPPNTLLSLEHQDRDGNHGYNGRWLGSQQCTGKHGSCRCPATEGFHRRQLPHHKQRHVVEGVLNYNQLFFFSIITYCGWLRGGLNVTLTNRWWCIPLEKSIRVEFAGGIAGPYQTVTAVTKELKPATWTEFGSVNHTPVSWRIIDATVCSWKHRKKEEFE